MLSDEEAKLAGKAIDLVQKTGPFLERVFGPLVEDGVGLVADRVRFFRLSNYIKLADRTAKLLEGRPHLRSASPKFALELIEAATIEESDEVGVLWARLLANSMDASFEGPIHIAYVSILREMTPREAKLLMTLSRCASTHNFTQLERPGGWLDMRTVDFRLSVGDQESIANAPEANKIQGLLNVPDDEFLSWQNLYRLNCVDLSRRDYASSVTLTIMGANLLRAAAKPAAAEG